MERSLVVGRPSLDPIERMRRRLLVHRDRLASLLDGLARGRAADEELHEWHRELKRLRIDGRLWVLLAPRGRATGYAETDAALKHLTREVGSVRNTDVSSELLERLGRGRRPPIPSVDSRGLRRRLAREAQTGRRSLAALVNGAAGEALLAGYERPLRAALPGAAIARLESAIQDALTVRLARLERALARAYRRPSVARLHRLRVALRSTRIVEQSRRAVLGGAPLPVSPALRKLQVDLGRLHDIEILRASARNLLRGDARARVDRALSRERRDRRRRLIRRLGRKSLRRDWERLFTATPS